MKIKKYRHEIEFLALAAIFLLIWWLGRYFQIETAALASSLKKFPLALRGLVYVGLYVVVTFFVFFSKDVFWVTGAFLFGAGLSTLFICIAETLNAGILFYLARRFGRSFVEKRTGEKYRRLDEKLARISLGWLFIFRVAPLIPYRFMDLGAGLTKMRFAKYLIAVAFGSPLKMFWIQYILAAVGMSIFAQPQELVNFFLRNQNLMFFSFIYLVLAAIAAFKIKSI